MKLAELRALRSAAQGLSRPRWNDAATLVRDLGAVQAQDLHGARWALGLRTGLTEAMITEALAAGHILRTHALRPTWHFIAPADADALIGLSASRIQMSAASRRRQLGLDDRVLKRAFSVIDRSFAGAAWVDRGTLAKALERARVPLAEESLSHVLMAAELQRRIISGPCMQGRTAYAPYEARVPRGPERSRAEVIVDLADRYFRTRGPATVRDLAWWAGLTLTDARYGAAALGRDLVRTEIDGEAYWHARDLDPGSGRMGTHLLPCYDEYVVAYQERHAVHDEAAAALSGSRGNPLFMNMVLRDGRVIGRWERELKARQVRLSVELAVPAARPWPALRKVGQRYGSFLGLPVDWRDPPRR